MAYEPVKKGELQVGRAVPWALYDEDQNLLLARGVVIESERQIEELTRRGLFRRLPSSGPLGARAEDDAGGAQPRDEIRTLDQIKLAIGDPLQLQAHSSSGSAPRYYVKLIGYLRGKGVIVTTPSQDGKLLLMREGQSFVVRLFSGKSVYAFGASVFKVANVPYPHLHLTWPSQVNGLVVRQGARTKVNIIGAVQDAHQRSHAATLINLSTGGCLLLAKAQLGIKDDRVGLKFRVSINDSEQYLDLRGVIRSISREGGEEGGPMIQHGIQFSDIAPNDRVVLTAYVYQKLFEEAAEV